MEQAIKIMGDTIEDMDLEIEQKDTKKDFLENEIGLPGFKVLEGMNKCGLNEISTKRREDRTMDELKIHSTITNTLKTKNNNDFSIETTFL